MTQCPLESASKQEDEDQNEEAIKIKMEELRKHSHSGVKDAHLRQGALLALGMR